MILHANCKINIGLDVLRRRDDGYHEVETLMYPVRGLCDEIEVVRNGLPHSRLAVQGISVDCPVDDNICMRAARIAGERFGTDGIDITLRKRVPFGAGLGGGSSDGVAVLKAVDALFDLNLCEDDLLTMAAELGSDTSFFVRNTPQMCTGRGEIVTPADVDLSGFTLVVAKPDEGVSTREAYAGITPSVPDCRLAELVLRPVSEWQGRVKNDFERTVFPAHPRIALLKQAMQMQGAVYSSMSGSGSAVFGLFERDVEFALPFDGVFVHKELL